MNLSGASLYRDKTDFATKARTLGLLASARRGSCASGDRRSRGLATSAILDASDIWSEWYQGKTKRQKDEKCKKIKKQNGNIILIYYLYPKGEFNIVMAELYDDAVGKKSYAFVCSAVYTVHSLSVLEGSLVVSPWWLTSLLPPRILYSHGQYNKTFKKKQRSVQSAGVLEGSAAVTLIFYSL